MNRQRLRGDGDAPYAVESLLWDAADFEPYAAMPANLERRALRRAARTKRNLRAVPLVLVASAVLAAAVLHRPLLTREPAYGTAVRTYLQLPNRTGTHRLAALKTVPQDRSTPNAGGNSIEPRRRITMVTAGDHVRDILPRHAVEQPNYGTPGDSSNTDVRSQ